MAPTVETVDPDETVTCALRECEAFQKGHRRQEACWLCWLAQRPHGWHPGDAMATRVPQLKPEPIRNSEEDPVAVKAPPATMPLFGEVHAAEALAAMKEEHGPARATGDEVLRDATPAGHPRRVEVLPLLRDQPGAGTSARATAAPPRRARTPATLVGSKWGSDAGEVTEWDIDWRV